MANIFALVAATVVLVLIPGPNVALIVANSLKHGLRFGLVTAFGTTAGIALQLLLVVAGLAALIQLAASTLDLIRWLGVAYLLYLAIRTWNEPAGDLAQVGPQSTSGTFWRGLGFAVLNPKTLLFNASFLPQFVSGTNGTTAELFVLAAVFLGVIITGDAMWALFAASARGWLTRVGRFRNKVTGGLLFGAGLGLAFARQNR
jgi:threonine/homoserine/homoserine lactone efflux protein